MFPPLLLANAYSTWGLAAALAALCYLALRSNWLRQRRSANTEPDPQAIREACAPKSREPSHHAPDEMLRWQVEMHETARDVKAEIDTKLVALQQLIILANEHAERLEALLARAEKTVNQEEATLASGREILDRMENGAGPLPPLDARAQGREVLTPAQAKLVRQLLSEEYTPAQIANYIGVPVADVEFFLNLSPAS
jgi:DNA-directed RNA polymerase specialized sigma24 family protein